MTKPPPNLPETLSLQQHIDLCTVPELEEFLRFWGPHEKGRNNRAELVEKLSRLMADENVVYAKVDLLSEKVRDVLLALLRKTHYTSDLQGLFRGLDGLEIEFYEGEAALTALAKRGFVRVSRAHEWLQYGRSAYAIPIEMALVMRGLAGADDRPLDHVFVHQTFTPSSVEAAANEAAAELPVSVHDAIRSLPNAILKIVATEVIERFGGIITRHEFNEVFAGRRIRWRSAQFLREFGSRGLGTVGHLDLRRRAIGVEDDALLFFNEAVERYVGEQRAGELARDLVLSAHGDLMSDVRTALGQTKEFTVRVVKEGSVYKASKARIAERLQFPAQPLLERAEIADRALGLVRTLGLANGNDSGQLTVTEKGAEWLHRPLLDKIRDAYGCLLLDGTQTLRSHHLRKVQPILVDLLIHAEPEDGWWPGTSLAMVARNRYLLELVRSDAAPHRAPLTVRHHALTELGGAAHDLVAKDLFALGLVDVAVRGDDVAGVRLSRLGRRLLANAKPEKCDRPLVINPDFEMLVLPEGDVDDLLHELDRFAARTRSGEVVHYQLDKDRIERAAADGESAETLLTLLARHSRAPIPQNVAYSIKSWSGGVQSATLARGVLFRANDPSVVDAIVNHAALKEWVDQVVDPTTLFFREDVTEEQIAQELRSLGIYVR